MDTLVSMISAPSTSKVVIVERDLMSALHVFIKVNKDRGYLSDLQCEYLEKVVNSFDPSTLFKRVVRIALKVTASESVRRRVLRARVAEDSMESGVEDAISSAYHSWLTSMVEGPDVIVLDADQPADGVYRDLCCEMGKRGLKFVD